MSATNYGPMTVAEHFNMARRAVKAARNGNKGDNWFEGWLRVADYHRAEAKHLRRASRPIERY